MNKMKFSLVCSAALAAGISLADTNSTTDFDKLTLEMVETFATPSTKVTVDGSYTLDGELSDLGLTVMPLVTKTPIEKFTLKFNVGFAEELPTTYESAVLGFAFKNASTAAYWDGSEWNEINFTASVTEDAEVTVGIEYDGRTTPAKARFTIGGEKIDEWFDVGTIGTNTIKAFGSGTVASIGGTTHKITAEEIVIPAEEGKKAIEVTIPEKEVQAIEKAGGATAESKIGGMNNIEAFILTGKAGDALVKPVAKIETTSTVNTKVNFKLDGVAVQTIKNGSVKFVLEGSSDNIAWTQIGEAATSPTIEMDISNAATYKFFRVKAKVEADSANN